MRKLLLIALLTAPALAYPPVPPPKEKKSPDAKSLEGEWDIVSYKGGGNVKSAVVYTHIVIEGGRWKQHRAANDKAASVMNLRFVVDTTKSPTQIDLYSSAKENERLFRSGVFKMEGETLTVRYTLVSKGNPRPTTVDGGLAAGEYRWVLKRKGPNGGKK
jgi:uncharacterized protein (TIGR03067 family)